MNRRTLARFRRCFVRKVPSGFQHDDPAVLLDEIQRIDKVHRSRACPDKDSPEWDKPAFMFLHDIVEDFEVSHLSTEELGPVLMEAIAAISIRS